MNRTKNLFKLKQNSRVCNCLKTVVYLFIINYILYFEEVELNQIYQINLFH